jgi:hypothetical protein
MLGKHNGYIEERRRNIQKGAVFEGIRGSVEKSIERVVIRR